MNDDRLIIHEPGKVPIERDWPDNDEALLELAQDNRQPIPENFWSVNDAFQGVQVFGGTGSGKTSGSGQALARAFMESNFGGLVLTAKTDEADAWRQYAEQSGRADDLIMVGEDEAYWQRTLKQLLRNTIDLAVLSLDDVDLPSLY